MGLALVIDLLTYLSGLKTQQVNSCDSEYLYCTDLLFSVSKYHVR